MLCGHYAFWPKPFRLWLFTCNHWKIQVYIVGLCNGTSVITPVHILWPKQMQTHHIEHLFCLCMSMSVLCGQVIFLSSQETTNNPYNFLHRLKQTHCRLQENMQLTKHQTQRPGIQIPCGTSDLLRLKPGPEQILSFGWWWTRQKTKHCR